MEGRPLPGVGEGAGVSGHSGTSVEVLSPKLTVAPSPIVKESKVTEFEILQLVVT